MPILHGEHIYEVMPTRKIWKINFQWNCSGWGYDRECEEGEVPVSYVTMTTLLLSWGALKAVAPLNFPQHPLIRQSTAFNSF